MSLLDPTSSFKGRWGKDWYVFRHWQLKSFIDQMAEAVKSVDATYKVLTDFGSLSDEIGYLRGTLGFISMP